MTRIILAIVFAFSVGCSGSGESSYCFSAIDGDFVAPPVEPQPNMVTESRDGYRWVGAPAPFSYQLDGAFVAEFNGGDGLWAQRCVVTVDGIEADVNSGMVLCDSLVTVWGCPFTITFYSSP